MKNFFGFVLMLLASSCFAWGGGHGGGGGHAGGSGHTSAHVSAHAEGEAHAVAESHEAAESTETAETPAQPMHLSFAPATSHVSAHGANASTSASDATASNAATSKDDVRNSDTYLSGLRSLFAALAGLCGLGIFLFIRRALPN